MKKALLLTGLLLVLAAPMASASGVSLAWGSECFGIAANSPVMTFACGSNTTPANWKMTASWMVDTDIPDYQSVDVFVEAVSETGAIPDWWKISASPDCRYASGNVTFAGVPSGSCADAFSGTQSGGGGYGYLVPGVQIQMEAIYATATPEGMPYTGGTENFAATYSIKNTKSTGTGACAGCATGMVFGLHNITLTSVAGSPINLTDMIPGGNQCLVWQHSFTGQPCNAPVPARNTTWGQVKSLYR